jgi:hypothetical protein
MICMNILVSIVASHSTTAKQLSTNVASPEQIQATSNLDLDLDRHLQI